MHVETRTVELKPIDRSNWHACVLLTVAETQKEFVSPNAISLAQAYAQREQEPFAIYQDDRMVGFLMYRFLDDRQAYYVQRLMVDGRFQGHGAGRAGMLALLARFAAERRSSRVLLSVIPSNAVAIKLYEGLGFRMTGEADEDGELEMENLF